MHIFLKEQKYLKDHAAKIHLIFKSPNENKQNQAFPNQKELCFDAYPNQKLFYAAIISENKQYENA
jgi:methionine-rich copper-binding protein CopC